MPKLTQLDKVLIALRAERDLINRSILMIEQQQQAIAAKPKRVRRPRLVEGTAS